MREDKCTTKLRVVYDASSSVGGKSLNECLELLPSKFTDLFSVIVRFRCHQITLIADIEKAYLSIGVREEDRNAMRLLWVDDPFDIDAEVKEKRFPRVCFGIISSMGHLGSTIEFYIEQYKENSPAVVEKIKDGLYVDDLSIGASDRKEATELFSVARIMSQDAGMNLRKWNSNDKEVNEFIQKALLPVNDDELDDSESHASIMLGQADDGSTKVLGVRWNVKDDVMELEYNVDCNMKRVTKRTLLSRIAAIYDPLGVLSPAILPLKLIFQEMCREGESWDDLISEECFKRWSKWCKSIRNYKMIEVPRCYVLFNRCVAQLQVIGFCDASKKAFAALLYLRAVYEDGEVSCSFIASKTRVAPMKEISIPRLELCGALVLARLLRRVVDVLKGTVKIKEEVCFTDSAVVLAWIRSGKAYKQYVQNRVNGIKELTDQTSWYHVNGVENVADLASRGCLPEDLERRRKNWIEGPTWLKLHKGDCPIREDVKDTVAP